VSHIQCLGAHSSSHAVTSPLASGWGWGRWDELSLALKRGPAVHGPPYGPHAAPGHQQPGSWLLQESGHCRPVSQPEETSQKSKMSQRLRTWQLNIAKCCEVLMSWWLDSVNVTSPGDGNQQANPSEPLPCTMLFEVFRQSQCKGYITAFRGWSVTKV